MGTEWEVPPDLRGRRRADRMYRALGALITSYDWLTAAYSRRPPTRRIDRDLSLVVDEVRVEAQDVRSLRLVAAGVATCPAGSRAATSTCCCPPDSVASTRCAAIPATAAPTGSRYDASPTAAAVRESCTTRSAPAVR
ncbi:MAG: hypothetical protein M3Y73_10710 [Actinomycetota bacterium]|nr:hypothetical protein [Actinomycetota bacterium]